MSDAHSVQQLRTVVAILRITLGVILLATWYDNLLKGVYTANGITELFSYLFNDNGGGPSWYRLLIQNTVLRAPGFFATFQLVMEPLLGLGLLLGALTPMAGLAAALFFFNLFLAYLGGNDWIWTYVLLVSSAVVAALTRSGRALGIDSFLLSTRGRPPIPLLW
jgi:hypothetical protein